MARGQLLPGVLLGVLLSASAAVADPPVAKPADVVRPAKTPAEIDQLLLACQMVGHLSQSPVSHAVWLGTAQHLAARADPDALWLNRRLQSALAAAEVVGVGNPLGVWSLYVAGRHEVVAWIGDPVLRVPPLNPEWLGSVRDLEPFANIGGKAPWDIQQAAWEEYAIYSQAMIQAHQTPLELFKQAAQDNAHLGFAHLYREPFKHRGKVVTLVGQLQRVSREDTPKLVEREGLKVFYEGWLKLDRPGTPPVCVLFTELPEGVKEGDGLSQRVSFTGYFFKKYRYVAGDRKSYTTLLLIGPTVTPEPGSAPATSTYTFPVRSELIVGIIGAAAGSVVLIFGLSWWLKRGDQRTRARLAQIHAGIPFGERPKFNAPADGFTFGETPASDLPAADRLQDEVAEAEKHNGPSADHAEKNA